MAELSLSRLIQESLTNINEEGSGIDEETYAAHERAVKTGHTGGSRAGSNSGYDDVNQTYTGSSNAAKPDTKLQGLLKNLKNRGHGAWVRAKLEPGKTAAKAAGGLAAAGAIGYGIHKGRQYLKDRNSLMGKIKRNPGKTAAGASLAALGAGAGVAALIRHLRKKKKSQ